MRRVKLEAEMWKSTLKFIAVGAIVLLSFSACQQESAPPPPVAVQGAPLDAPLTVSPSPPVVGMGVKVAPTDPAERAKLAEEAPQPESREGYVGVSFSELSNFSYQTDPDGRLLETAKLPEEIAQLDEKQVAVSGYLVPIEFQDDKVSSLILVRNQLLCCYGEEPQLNEWIFVNVNPPVELVSDIPVTLFGKFYASPDEEEGQVISLYRMEATDMEAMD